MSAGSDPDGRGDWHQLAALALARLWDNEAHAVWDDA